MVRRSGPAPARAAWPAALFGRGACDQAAIAGHGIALLSLALVAQEIASGQLVQPFGPALAGHGYHRVWSAGRAAGAEVMAAVAVFF